MSKELPPNEYSVSVDESSLDSTDDGPVIIIGASILAVLAMIFVALRFWSKRLSGNSWKLDEWLVLAALITHFSLMASSFVGVRKGGLGRDIDALVYNDPKALVVLFKTILASDVAYGFSSSLVKLSVLSFYWQMFPTKSVRIGCYVIGGMCISWTATIQILNFLQCRPLKAFWHVELQHLPGTKCFDPVIFSIGNSAANCLIDLATLTLPIHEVMKLQISRSQKICTAGIFLLGGLAFASSLTRTIAFSALYREGNVNCTKQAIMTTLTTIIEIYVAIIGACLPILMPVYRKLRYGNALHRTNKSSRPESYFTTSSRDPSIRHDAEKRDSQSNSESSLQRLYENDLAVADCPNSEPSFRDRMNPGRDVGIPPQYMMAQPHSNRLEDMSSWI